MRGRLRTCRGRPEKVGSTPAYAGKITTSRRLKFRSRKHPRVCGEDKSSGILSEVLLEAPPRMRGRSCLASKSKGSPRSTPAYAGKIRHRQSCQSERRKHPRVCGEDRGIELHATHTLEAPPRMRGRSSPMDSFSSSSRSTPAYAGKINGCLNALCSGWKHPRVCGEDLSQLTLTAQEREAPPRMRGR